MSKNVIFLRAVKPECQFFGRRRPGALLELKGSANILKGSVNSLGGSAAFLKGSAVHHEG